MEGCSLLLGLEVEVQAPSFDLTDVRWGVVCYHSAWMKVPIPDLLFFNTTPEAFTVCRSLLLLLFPGWWLLLLQGNIWSRKQPRNSPTCHSLGSETVTGSLCLYLPSFLMSVHMQWPEGVCCRCSEGRNRKKYRQCIWDAQLCFWKMSSWGVEVLCWHPLHVESWRSAAVSCIASQVCCQLYLCSHIHHLFPTYLKFWFYRYK